MHPNPVKVGLIYSAVVLQLLNAKIIQSSGLDVSPWIQYNITSDPLSLDATFLKIVEMYVKSLAEIKTFSPLPFELLEGLKTIPETPLDVGKNLSVMYYFLLYNSQLRDPRVSQCN